ncbi:MAG: cytochrome C [Metallibacterium sp.]
MSRSLAAPRALRWLHRTLLLGAGALALLPALPAQAVPMFARETGQPCVACHIGGFGPQLTPFGRQFKLDGYRLDVHNGWDTHVSMMAIESFTATRKGRPTPPASGFKDNDNSELQQVSLFYGGRLADHWGMLGQVTYSQNGGLLGWDNTDVRYAHNYTLGNGKGGVFGLSFNNNPTVSDVFQTAPAWMYPYTTDDLGYPPPATPAIMGGFEQQVAGMTAYTMFDGSWYAEAGFYRTLSTALLNRLNAGFNGRIVGAAPYARVAYTRGVGSGDVEVGGFYFDARQGQVGTDARGNPISIPGPYNAYRDLGLDASYQFLGSGRNIFTCNGLWVNEEQTLNGTYSRGGSSNLRNTVDAVQLNGAYWLDNTYGVQMAVFRDSGTADPVLYASRTGSPTTQGSMLEVDYNPFGKSTSWHQPWVNLRLGLQYIYYTLFDGAARNYDGAGRNAHDNNTLYGYVWIAF